MYFFLWKKYALEKFRIWPYATKYIFLFFETEIFFMKHFEENLVF